MTRGHGPRAPRPIEVVESETVVERGTREVRWYVRKGRVWVKAPQWAGVEIQAVEAGPGSVWERRLRLVLPPGTELLRTESRPAPLRRSDPMHYLRREIRRGQQVVHHTPFRVTPEGELRPEQRPAKRPRFE